MYYMAEMSTVYQLINELLNVSTYVHVFSVIM